MTSGVEITAPITVTLDPPGPSGNKFYTAYPFSQTFVEEEVLPYMARAQSPVRVSFTPSTLGIKRKSRVTDTAKNAIFNYKPLRRGDNSSVLKFRSPDATLPTLQYLSPWISITKTDYQDPRLSGDFTNTTEVTHGLLGRSYTDMSIDISRRNTISRAESLRKSDVSSQQRSRANDTRETSAKTVSSLGKRVKILDPTEEVELEVGMNGTIAKPIKSSPSPLFKAKLTEIKDTETGVNYYSGYLPPELSDKIAEKLKISAEHSANENSAIRDGQIRTSLPAQFYKPLVGDRNLYMHESYPARPKILQSDIDQLRLEGRKRFLQSHGQVPVHFSALKNRGTLVRPKQKGARLDEAVREQQRQAHSAKISRQPGQATSLEVFQQQRERTYHLQKLAKEMINK